MIPTSSQLAHRMAGVHEALSRPGRVSTTAVLWFLVATDFDGSEALHHRPEAHLRIL
jgi:hypothetical protein